MVIEKPSGLLSLSGKNPLNKDSVHHRLVQHYPSATMVHRLDFGTSGLMVVALKKEANAHLTKQFQARTVSKTYIAILFGDLKEDHGVIDMPIAKSDFPYQKACAESGKSALSHYRVLTRKIDAVTGAQLTRVLFTPITGRTHQLRVHSREIGHPIIGCDLYGLQQNGIDSERLASRLMLHANGLQIQHPVSFERLQFESEPSF